MGYRREPRIYKLAFEDPDMDGLVIRVRSLPIGKFVELTRAAAAVTATESNEASAEQTDILFRALASSIVEWNLEEEGPDGRPWPVPADLDGLYRQDMPFAMAIIEAWLDAVAAVPPPLPASSTGGRPSLEASLPMEPLSPGRQS